MRPIIIRISVNDHAKELLFATFVTLFVLWFFGPMVKEVAETYWSVAQMNRANDKLAKAVTQQAEVIKLYGEDIKVGRSLAWDGKLDELPKEAYVSTTTVLTEGRDFQDGAIGDYKEGF